ncbi:hypothetical protein Nepgr_002974 [Nepenthes gracilis]|uniref:Uncharacterized protein n=1 Tax=Nepenthes gracilis TaxID=150966 RepID=A0AAD3RYN2_NEPGR|nr:hypothetical protein Nepgr_002974 [Nepenthes gracilis]
MHGPKTQMEELAECTKALVVACPFSRRISDDDSQQVVEHPGLVLAIGSIGVANGTHKDLLDALVPEHPVNVGASPPTASLSAVVRTGSVVSEFCKLEGCPEVGASDFPSVADIPSPFAINERVLQHSIAKSEMQAKVILRVAISSEDALNDKGESSSIGEVVGSPAEGPAPSTLKVFPASDLHGTPTQNYQSQTVYPFLFMVDDHHGGDHEVGAPTMDQSPCFDDVDLKLAMIEARISYAAGEASPNFVQKITIEVESLRRRLATLKANRILVLTKQVGSGTITDLNDHQCYSLETSNVLKYPEVMCNDLIKSVTTCLVATGGTVVMIQRWTNVFGWQIWKIGYGVGWNKLLGMDGRFGALDEINIPIWMAGLTDGMG